MLSEVRDTCALSCVEMFKTFVDRVLNTMQRKITKIRHYKALHNTITYMFYLFITTIQINRPFWTISGFFQEMDIS